MKYKALFFQLKSLHNILIFPWKHMLWVYTGSTSLRRNKKFKYFWVEKKASYLELPCSTWPHRVDWAVKPQHKQLSGAMNMKRDDDDLLFWHYISHIKTMQRPGSDGCTSDWRSWGCGFYPHQVGNILSWRLIMRYFLQSFLPSADSRRAVDSFCRKNVHNTS